MCRILLISDTHGNLDIINEKVAKTNADMVICQIEVSGLHTCPNFNIRMGQF